jgi:rare lipoprotein A
MRPQRVLLALGATVACLLLIWEAAAQRPPHSKATAATTQRGIATVYSDTLQGKRLASGEKYDDTALTAAHRSLPMGTMVKVTNLKNNKSVVVKINDRGPHGPKKKIIDLSGRAARELEMVHDGKAKVKLEVVMSPKS